MTQTHSLMRYSMLSFVSLSTFVLSLTLAPARAAAQQITLSGGANSMSPLEALRIVVRKEKQDRVILSPEHGTVDANTHTTTITLTNPGPDTLNLALVCQAAPPAHAVAKASHATTGMTKAGTNPGTTHPAGDATASDTTHSLASWVSGLPTTLHLLPHATQKITLTVAVPSHATSGDYSGWVIVTSAASDEVLSSGMHVHARPQVSAEQLTYHVQ